MVSAKPHIEFLPVSTQEGWERPAGYPEGFEQLILASDIDEEAKTGSRSRLLRLHPGAFSTVPFVHDHWEEVFVVEGDLRVGNDAQGRDGESFMAPTYACRPPGVHHGPFASDEGCVLFEMHYYK